MKRLSPNVIAGLWLLALTILAFWLRWPALSTEGFHNEDAAGIAYNADLLRHGLLPLIDNVDMKAPGSFYLSAFFWSILGRSLTSLQTAAALWSVLGMIGIFVGGRILYGVTAGCVAATLYALAAPITDSIDINYGAWMITPYIWATVCFLWSIKTGRGRWLLATGVLLAMAGLMKRQAAVLFPLFFAGIFVQRWISWPEDWEGFPDWRRSVGFLFGGLALGFAPIFLWYASQGGLRGFLDSYAFSKDGWRYVKGSQGLSERMARLGDGLLGFFEYVALPTVLASFTAVMACRPSSKWTARGIFLTVFLLLSFVGAALGLRFFKGYYLHVLPALVWIAAHPKGPIGQWFDSELWVGTRRVLLSLGAVLVLVAVTSPAAIGDGHELIKIRKRRAVARDHLPQKIAQYIKKNSESKDRIWVWGRWAWPVYFHADRLAATRYPKTLGVFTTTLTNTWRRPTKNTAFDPKSPWPKLIEQLKTDKPVFIVLSHNESYRKFKALNALLRSDYHAVKSLKARGFSIYRLGKKVKSHKARPKGTNSTNQRPFKTKTNRVKGPRLEAIKRGEGVLQPSPPTSPRFDSK